MSDDAYEPDGTTGMSAMPFVPMPIWVLEHQRISARAKLMWAFIARYSSMRDGARPARKTLAKLMGYSRAASVDGLLKELVENGLIVVTPRRGADGSRLSSHYEVIHGLWGAEPAPAPAPTSDNAEDTPRTQKRTPPVRETAHPPYAQAYTNKNNYSYNHYSYPGSHNEDTGTTEELALIDAPVNGELDDEDRRNDRTLAEKLKSDLLARGAKRGFAVTEDAVSEFAGMRVHGYTHTDLWHILRFVHASRHWGSKVRTPSAMRRNLEALAVEAHQKGFGEGLTPVPGYGGPATDTNEDRQRGWFDMAAELREMGVE